MTDVFQQQRDEARVLDKATEVVVTLRNHLTEHNEANAIHYMQQVLLAAEKRGAKNKSGVDNG